MSWWSVYFLSKTVLHFWGRLHMDPLLNPGLMALAWIPLPARWPRHAALTRLKTAAAAAAAAWLLWRESWLPPPSEAIKFLARPEVNPSPGYVLAFLVNGLDWRALGAASLVIFAAWRLSRAGIRLTALAVMGVVAVGISDPYALLRDEAGRELSDFYKAESSRVVRFPAAGSPPFDIILIHSCSLSWEDIKAAGISDDAFWGSFDVTFKRFNSATSYSNPAALRLLRAPCGQRPNSGLFRPEPAACYLLESLRAAGYQTRAASNHDGRYDDFAAVISEHGRADSPLPVTDLAPALLNFDASAIYSDRDVLGRWWSGRVSDPAPRAALYYNSVSLHQGAYKSGQSPAWGTAERMLRYGEHARESFRWLEAFFDDLRASGRRAVVVFVGEHGAALRGSRIQVPDLREIPLPELTNVPAAVKLIGPGLPPRPARVAEVSGPSSYLALAELLSRMIGRSPFGKDFGDLGTYLAGLPETPSVADARSYRVMKRRGGGTWSQRGRERWRELPASPEGLP